MKTCQAENCISPVFAKNLCQRHQYMRTDKKPKRGDLRQPSKKRASIPNWGFEDQITMFWYIWEARMNKDGSVTCPYTDEKLHKYSAYYLNHFAHLLNKKNYPYFKLNPDNVDIVFPEFHRVVDQGTSKDRVQHPDWKFAEWDAKVLEMKEEYKKFKQINLLP